MTEDHMKNDDKSTVAGILTARVTAVHCERYELVCEERVMFGRLKTGVYYGEKAELFPTVGDWVRIQPVEGGDSLITGTLPRRSFFARRDPDPMGGKQQAVAANFETVFIMTSLNKDFNTARLERYLVQAWQSGAVPVVILTKADLCDDPAVQVAEVESVAAGVDVIPMSVVSGEGLDRLDVYLTPGKTIVFLGSSGVGKSSLLNALMGREVMAAGDIREDDSRGRHTTTHRQMFTLPSGAMVIDTPGMRTMGMWDAGDGLGAAFRDVEAVLSQGCRFSDCRHETEPGCAVRSAIDSGTLPAARWRNYQALRQEAKYAEDRAGFLRAKQQRNKSIAQFSRQHQKNGGIRT